MIIQPVLVWDDGEELAPGPELGQIELPLPMVLHFAEGLPAEVAALQEKLAEKHQ